MDIAQHRKQSRIGLDSVDLDSVDLDSVGLDSVALDSVDVVYTESIVYRCSKNNLYKLFNKFITHLRDKNRPDAPMPSVYSGAPWWLPPACVRNWWRLMCVYCSSVEAVSTGGYQVCPTIT